MQPDKNDFAEWLQMPVTEWVLALCGKFSEQQKDRAATIMWDSGQADQAVLSEARLRADCYMALAQSTYDDWKAIDDSEG